MTWLSELNYYSSIRLVKLRGRTWVLARVLPFYYQDNGREQMIRVALYSRVSTAEQAREGVSIDAQLVALRTHARLKGWQVVGEYVDAGYSGNTDQRPRFQQLLIDAKRHNFDVVAVAKLDRLFRNLRLLLNYLHELEQLEVHFVATQEGLDTSTPQGKFSVQVLGVIAEFERARIGERISEGKQYRMSQGKWASGRTVYGYRWLPKSQEWKVIQAEAEVVRYIYHLYVNEGLGSMRIPIRLNSEGYRTRQGSAWGFSAVNRVLTHPAYKGQHPKGLEMPKIIDEHAWELAQRQRQRARSVRKEVNSWLLQGMAVCGQCGHTLSCIQKKPTKPRYYACRGRYKDSHLDGSPLCLSPRIEADWLEKVVWDKFSATINDTDMLRQSVADALSVLHQKKNQLGDTKSLDHEIEENRDSQERLGLAYSDRAIRKETYDKKLQELKREEVQLLRRIANLDPEAQAEVTELKNWIASAEKMLDKKLSTVQVSKLGIWGASYDTTDGTAPKKCTLVFLDRDQVESSLERIGKPRAPHAVRMDIAELSLEVNAIGVPEDVWRTQLPQETLTKNMRDTLLKFDTKIYAFPDKVEIRGLIPTQIIRVPLKVMRSKRKLNIPSAYRPAWSHPAHNRVTGL